MPVEICKQELRTSKCFSWVCVCVSVYLSVCLPLQGISPYSYIAVMIEIVASSIYTIWRREGQGTNCGDGFSIPLGCALIRDRGVETELRVVGVRILCSKIRELCYALMLTLFPYYAPQVAHYAHTILLKETCNSDTISRKNTNTRTEDKSSLP